MLLLLLSRENVLCSGGQLVLERVTELLNSPEPVFMLRCRLLNGGTDTAVKEQLLLMNFEETLVSVTSLDGWISIPFWSRSKGGPFPCWPRDSTSPPTSNQTNGTLTWIKQQWKLSLGVLLLFMLISVVIYSLIKLDKT